MIHVCLQAAPFQEFVLFLADGRSLPVPNPEFLMFPDDGQSLQLFQPQGTLESIDPNLVVSVRTHTPA